MVALDFPDAPTVGQVFDKWTWNGTQWVLTAGVSTGWQTFTPTWTNVTPGNATVAFLKRYEGKTLHIHGSFTIGTTTVLTTSNIILTLPDGSTASQPAPNMFVGQSAANIGGFYPGTTLMTSVTTLVPHTYYVVGTNVAIKPMTGTSPATFGTGHVFTITASIPIV